MMALLSADARSRVEHIACDFMADPKDIAMKINNKGVREVDVVFFYSYIQPKVDAGATAWSNADALVQANCTFDLILLGLNCHVSLLV